MTHNRWKIGLVEDQQKYRDFIQEVLENDPCVEQLFIWNSAEEFWNDQKGLQLDLIFIDIMLPHMNGVELTRLINERNPEIAKIILTNITQEEVVFKSLQNGAIGYILKEDLSNIPQHIHTIMNGGAIISPTIALRVINSFKKKPADGYPKLTSREKQVLEQLINGYTKKKVSELLGVTESTLCWHVKNIYKKLNVKSKLDLLKRCNELDII